MSSFNSPFLSLIPSLIKSFLLILLFVLNTQDAQSQQSHFWNSIQYFKPEEFYTNAEIHAIDTSLVLLLDRTRHHLGKPIKISSAVRSNYYNRMIGGKIRSDHTTGNAVDILTPSATYRAQLIFSLLLTTNSRNQSIKILIYPAHIHLSINTKTTQIFVAD